MSCMHFEGVEAVEGVEGDLGIASQNYYINYVKFATNVLWQTPPLSNCLKPWDLAPSFKVRNIQKYFEAYGKSPNVNSVS